VFVGKLPIMSRQELDAALIRKGYLSVCLIIPHAQART